MEENDSSSRTLHVADSRLNETTYAIVELGLRSNITIQQNLRRSHGARASVPKMDRPAWEGYAS